MTQGTVQKSEAGTAVHAVGTMSIDFEVVTDNSPLATPEAILAETRVHLLSGLAQVLEGPGLMGAVAQVEVIEIDLGEWPADPDWSDVRKTFVEKLLVGLQPFLQWPNTPVGSDVKAGEVFESRDVRDNINDAALQVGVQLPEGGRAARLGTPISGMGAASQDERARDTVLDGPPPNSGRRIGDQQVKYLDAPVSDVGGTSERGDQPSSEAGAQSRQQWLKADEGAVLVSALLSQMRRMMRKETDLGQRNAIAQIVQALGVAQNFSLSPDMQRDEFIKAGIGDLQPDALKILASLRFPGDLPFDKLLAKERMFRENLSLGTPQNYVEVPNSRIRNTRAKKGSGSPISGAMQLDTKIGADRSQQREFREMQAFQALLQSEGVRFSTHLPPGKTSNGDATLRSAPEVLTYQLNRIKSRAAMLEGPLSRMIEQFSGLQRPMTEQARSLASLIAARSISLAPNEYDVREPRQDEVEKQENSQKTSMPAGGGLDDPIESLRTAEFGELLTDLVKHAGDLTEEIADVWVRLLLGFGHSLAQVHAALRYVYGANGWATVNEASSKTDRNWGASDKEQLGPNSGQDILSQERGGGPSGNESKGDAEELSQGQHLVHRDPVKQDVIGVLSPPQATPRGTQREVEENSLARLNTPVADFESNRSGPKVATNRSVQGSISPSNLEPAGADGGKDAEERSEQRNNGFRGDAEGSNQENYAIESAGGNQSDGLAGETARSGTPMVSHIFAPENERDLETAASRRSVIQSILSVADALDAESGKHWRSLLDIVWRALPNPPPDDQNPATLRSAWGGRAGDTLDAEEASDRDDVSSFRTKGDPRRGNQPQQATSETRPNVQNDFEKSLISKDTASPSSGLNSGEQLLNTSPKTQSHDLPSFDSGAGGRENLQSGEQTARIDPDEASDFDDVAGKKQADQESTKTPLSSRSGYLNSPEIANKEPESDYVLAVMALVSTPRGPDDTFQSFLADRLAQLLPDRQTRRNVLRQVAARLSYPDGSYSPALRHHALAAVEHVLSQSTSAVSAQQVTEKNDELRGISDDAAVMPLQSDQAFLSQRGGLILFHPYLPLLFERLEILDGKRQIPKENIPVARRALQLIGDVQSVEDQPTDPVEKMLLGLPQDWSTSGGTPAKTPDLELINSLLASVIERWGALGQTSPDGLRDAFIRRNATLRRQEMAWLLRVDTGPFDMLLDRLPWSFGIIGLPWMPEPCNVHWRDSDA